MATNLLPPNVARGTDTYSSTAGFDDPDQCTIASSTDYAAEGSRSLKLTSTSTSTASVYIPYYSDPSWPTGAMTVTPSSTYSAMVSARKASGATALYCTVMIYWWQSGGTPASTAYNEGSAIALSTSFQQAYVTATAPSNAAYATIRATIQSSITSSDSYYMDKFGFVAGSDTTWSDPSGPTPTGIDAVATVPNLTEVRNVLIVPGGTSKQGVWA